MAEVLIISGAGDYSDPWHRFGDTSLRLAEIIAGLGHQVTVSDAVEQALADPGEPGLIVVNIGNPASLDPAVHRCRGAGTRSPSSARWRASRTACQRHIDDHHVAMVQADTGCKVTMHPKQDLFTVVVHDGAHPIVEGLSDFTVFDERYCYLHTNPDITVMCEQVTDGRLHPIVWGASPGLAEWFTRAWVTRSGRTEHRPCESASSHRRMAPGRR